METVVLDTLGKLRRRGHGLFGWCSPCGSPSRYWQDVRARRTPRPASFDVDLNALIRERGDRSSVLAPIPCAQLRLDEYRGARDDSGQARGRRVKLDLTDEERRPLLRLVRDALDASRYPLSPEAALLRELAEKLPGDDKNSVPRR